MDWPETLSINAWTGDGQPTAPVAEGARGWAVGRHMDDAGQPLAAAEPVDPRDWRDPKVGWGLILPENEAISQADRAVGADAPEPIRKLLAARPGSPVFRYRPGLHHRFLRRYYTDRPAEDRSVTDSQRGTGNECIPRYLLLCGSPEVLPWSLQFVLNTAAYVGRLDLDEEGLARYVEALLTDWQGADCRPDRPVIWAVDHGAPDITALMRRAIAEPMAEKLRQDGQIGADNVRFMSDGAATVEALTQALAEVHPAVVVTTSHGMTGPLGEEERDRMASQLGLLVDDRHDLLQPEALLQRWQPNGVVWYAHACCSAGSDFRTRFKGLAPPGSQVEQVLEAVAALGARTAPLPRKLLGAEKPLRAFIGHVEPTFDWTLRAENRQILTESLLDSLYGGLYRARPEPVGMAFEETYRRVGDLLGQWIQAVDEVNEGVSSARAAALRSQLTALDRQNMVILGDPTVAPPALG